MIIKYWNLTLIFIPIFCEGKLKSGLQMRRCRKKIPQKERQKCEAQSRAET